MENGAYTVGYGKPPKGHQWKPGQSGNFRGRPKRKKSQKGTTLKQLAHVLQADRTIIIDGKPSTVSFAEAFVRVLMNDSLSAPFKLKMELFSLFARIGVFDQERDLLEEEEYEPPTLTEAQRQLLEMCKRSIAAADALDEDADILPKSSS